MRVYDDIDRHMAAAGDIERAAVPPGFFVAWAAKLQLLSDGFERDHGEALLRLRMHDLSPGAFFTTCCSGRFGAAHLDERGRRFVERYYEAHYMADFAETFGLDPQDSAAIYTIADDWRHYALLAPVLTRRLFAADGAAARHSGAASTARRWLRVITGGKGRDLG